MSLIKKTLSNIGKIGLTTTILFSLGNCAKVSDSGYKEIKKEVPQKVDYFDSIPMVIYSGMALISGDFDNDGDLDFIVGARDGSLSTEAGRLYFFENDGKGNFTKREYSK